MSPKALIVADAGPGDGLGHVSRSSALALALHERNLECTCLGHGSQAALERDGVPWQPLPDSRGLNADGFDAVVVDSYHLAEADLARLGADRPLVVLHDHGDAAGPASIVVNAGGDGPEDSRYLAGPKYACLRPMFWDLPERVVGGEVGRVLVTTGAGDPGNLAAPIAASVRAALRSAEVSVVRGPQFPADWAVPEGVNVIDAPDCLLEPFAESDLVITGAGQSMFEAAATGAPALVVVVAENQRAQAERLMREQAVRVIDPPDPDRVAEAAAELAQDMGMREALSRRARRVADGQGARRVAERIAGVAQAPLTAPGRTL